jgi:hypothetical protein
MQNKLFVRIMVIVLIIAMIVPSFAFALAWMLG